MFNVFQKFRKFQVGFVLLNVFDSRTTTFNLIVICDFEEQERRFHTDTFNFEFSLFPDPTDCNLFICLPITQME
jgi:hypothetical protein